MMATITIDYHTPIVGGVFTEVTDGFNNGPLWHLCRTLRVTHHDAGVLVCYG